MVLVCNWISDTVRLCGFSLCISDWKRNYDGISRNWNGCGSDLYNRIFVSAVAPLQRKSEPDSTKEYGRESKSLMDGKF